MTAEATKGYHERVKTTDAFFDSLKEWVTASNPGLVTKADLARLEARLDDILELVEELEDRLKAGGSTPDADDEDDDD